MVRPRQTCCRRRHRCHRGRDAAEELLAERSGDPHNQVQGRTGSSGSGANSDRSSRETCGENRSVGRRCNCKYVEPVISKYWGECRNSSLLRTTHPTTAMVCTLNPTPCPMRSTPPSVRHCNKTSVNGRRHERPEEESSWFVLGKYQSVPKIY